MRRSWVGGIIALALALGVPSALVGQPRDKAVATDIRLIELDEPNQGSMAMIDGRLEGGEPDRFTLGNLSIFQPVKVSLLAEDVGQPVRLALGKFDWKEDFGGAGTGSAGVFTKEFKTQGDLLLSVSGEAGAGYRLVIWAGDELPPEMDPVIVPASEAGGSGWMKTALIAAGALALLAGGWFFMRNRRRPA